jgi:catechol 2,3-dioxygenase-like lactoylglutathione lyase family enzyme
MIDHLSIVVSDYEKSKAFYERVLAALGATVLREHGRRCGFGHGPKPTFWIGEAKPSFWSDAHRASAAPVHIAFEARSRAEVDAFYAAALAAGAPDFGKPGPRPIYHPGYYGAFVLDPDGNDVEAVIHGPDVVAAAIAPKIAAP